MHEKVHSDVRMRSNVVSIRIPKELKEKMRRYRINWSDEIRRFIENRIRVLELVEILDEIESRVEKPRVRVDSVELIRESREEN